MKVDKFKDELRQLDAVRLQEKVEQLRHELFRLRLNSVTAHIKDYSQFKNVRRNIARVLTFMRQKENI